MSSDFTENVLVELPAIRLFEELGWASVSAKDEVFGPKGTLGREIKSDVAVVPRLRCDLEMLNSQRPSNAITSAVDEVVRDRSAMSLAAANREIWELLRDGVKVSVPDLERGGQKIERVRLAGRGESLSGWLVDSGK